MQDRPRFTGTLIISVVIHFAVPFLAATLLSPAQIDFKNTGLVLVCYIYVPFALSGSLIGLHPYLIRPVLAAFISSSFVFVVSYMSQNLLAAPAIVFSTLSAYLANPYKIGSPKNAPLEQDVDERGDGAAGQRDEDAEHKQYQDDRG